MVYAEAMSQGLPVIYLRGQGFDGQCENGKVGFSVDYFDENEIAKKIISLIDNYHQISENCSKYCDKFSWNQISDSYEALYKN